MLSDCPTVYALAIAFGLLDEPQLQFAGDRLAARQELTFEQYAEMLPHALATLAPEKDVEVDLDRWGGFLDAEPAPPLLVHTRTKDYHRAYEWR